MSSAAQRTELQAQIWKIANEVRGSVDGWDFKQYVLGILFYRFISENFSNYMEGGDDSIHYAELDDTIITKEIKEDAVKTKGYFIYPSQLFCRIAENANTNESLNTDLKTIFDEIENSASGYPSEQDIKGLFADFDTTSNRLGNTVKDKNTRLAVVIKGVEGLNFGNFEDNQIDLFGDAYEFLISNYAANAGKSGGEFFTPQCVSKLIAKLAIHGQDSINKIYDPAAGSGSLLLQAKKQFDEHMIEDGFFGQEINHTTYNLARMNMFLHNVNYDKFNIALGNTLTEPHFRNDKPFDAIVSNPPYSINWIGSDDPTLINDERFAPAGVLAPKSKADFAFILHSLSYLSSKGRAVIVCFPGIFYRGGAEQKIRKYLVDNNFVETVIALALNLFYGTSLLIVVGMFLTGFDAPTLNTLFVDKNLRYHGLMQAFSRTNRIYDSTKTFGNIVTFRNLEQATIDAIKCFGDDNTRNIVLEKSYKEYMEGFKDNVTGKVCRGYVDVVGELKSRFTDVEEIVTEKDKKEFVQLFGEYLKIENILQNYDEFISLKELQKVDLGDSEAVENFKVTYYVSDEDMKAMQSIDILDERTIQDYRSTYNDIREWLRREKEGKDKENLKIDWDDVVFEVDLLKSQEINLDYIIELIFEKNQNITNKNVLIEEIRRITRSSAENRAKESLIVNFINWTDLGEIQDKESIIDAFYRFAQKEQKKEAEELIKEEQFNEQAAKRYILASLKKRICK